MAGQRIFRQNDFSGALQIATTRLLRKRNEVSASKNAEYNRRIGAAAGRYGYEQVGNVVVPGYNKDSLGGGVIRYDGRSKIIAAHNVADDSSASVRSLYGSEWVDLVTDLPSNTKIQFIDHLDETYIVGVNDRREFMQPVNIRGGDTVSTSRNVYRMPRAKFIAEFKGSLYAINVEVDGVEKPDTVYKSSPPLGAVTLIQGDQKGLLLQLKVNSVRYLKPGMVVDIYGGGTEAKKVDSLSIISVDKVNNLITFSATSINLKDNDEVWLEDRKNEFSILWNTDYPTSQEADFLQIPPGTDSSLEITGWGKNNNRLFFFTRDSFLKWDGSSLIVVAPTIGCVSHKTIKNIGAWTLWLHTTGVWGYNDSTGQLKLLSRGIDGYIKAIIQSNLEDLNAVVIGRIYKLVIGQINELESETTSTSTSSTSTSSTSSSTSSTSTSSTSTSSTSSSTSRSSTSTSSTSTSSTSTSLSTSSTSISTSSTSTSQSTSSTSTSTTTVEDGKQVYRIDYDFDSNNWWPEQHHREIRDQFIHSMHGYTKPYFFDETGRLFRDETGNVDHNETIPIEVEAGPQSFDTEQLKTLDGLYLKTEYGAGAQVLVQADGGNWLNIGQLKKDVEQLVVPKGIRGRVFNVKLTHNDEGQRPVFVGIDYIWTSEEEIYGPSR